MKKSLLLLFIVYTPVWVLSQETNLDSLLDAGNAAEATTYVSTFKTSRIINGHSVENTQAGILDLRISHRFGRLNQGSYDLFGLDNASMRMGLDYGIIPRLTVGIGRSTFQKQYDGFIKYSVLKQSTGKKNIPLSLSLLTSANVRTVREPDPAPGVKARASDKWSFVHQLMIARKFGKALSLQLTPTMIHYNIVPLSTMKNDYFSVGVGGALRLSPRVTLNAEYYPQINQMPGTQNSLSVGFDIETGGHVFQLNFTNSTGITERTFIAETDGTWGNGDIHFGFTISRVFSLKRSK